MNSKIFLVSLYMKCFNTIAKHKTQDHKRPNMTVILIKISKSIILLCLLFKIYRVTKHIIIAMHEKNVRFMIQ